MERLSKQNLARVTLNKATWIFEQRRTDMPTLSEFFGILIRMYWDDHPPPHFHALYGEFEAQYNIVTLDVIVGALPRRAHAMVVE